MHSENWDDLRFVLAVVESGTVSGAARHLNVNHATVLRRIASFEDRHAIHLFEKTPQGYNVPRDRQRVVEALKEVAAAMQSVERVMRGTLAPLTGVIRITSTDTMCHGILPSILSHLSTENDRLRVQIICSNAHLDMARLQADIAVRPALQLPEDLFGEVVAQLGFAVYAGPECTGRWIGMAGALEQSIVAKWQVENVPAGDISHAADSFLIMKELAIAGQGFAILPCILGDGHPQLQRIDDMMPHQMAPLWVASHVDLADSPRLRTLRSRLGAALSAQSARLSGLSAPPGEHAPGSSNLASR